MAKKHFESIVMNFAPGPHLRYEMLDGREYLVAPMVMLTVGVHSGSNGPVLYEEHDLAKTPEVWNMKPLCVYHPTHNGEGVSACSPQVIETQGVGLIMNTQWNGKLRAEAWFDIKKLERVDKRILNALEESKLMEVSTGLFTDNEQSEGTYEPTGEEYVAIARNFRPDHLAILPDKIGACSIADGAGLLQTNALSMSDTQRQLGDKVREMFGDDAWVVDVYDSWFVYARKNKLWKLSYAKTNDMVSVGGESSEAVVPQTIYKSVDGEVLANSVYPFSFTKPKETPMAKKELVDALIKNDDTKWTDDHRSFLESQSDEFVEGLTPKAVDPKDEPKEPVKEPTKNEANPVTPAPVQPVQTLDQLLANADPAMRGMIQQGLATYKQNRLNLIAKVKGHPGCTFNDAQLDSMSDDLLTATASTLDAAAAAAAPQQNEQYGLGLAHTVPSYAGASGSVPTSNMEEEVLALPSSI